MEGVNFPASGWSSWCSEWQRPWSCHSLILTFQLHGFENQGLSWSLCQPHIYKIKYSLDAWLFKLYKFKLYTAIVLIHKSQRQSDTRSQLDITSQYSQSVSVRDGPIRIISSFRITMIEHFWNDRCCASCVLLLPVIYYNHTAILAAIFGFGSVTLLTG